MPVAVLTGLVVLGSAGPAGAAPDPSRALYLTPGQLAGAVVTTTFVTETPGGASVTTSSEQYDNRGRATLLTVVTTDGAGGPEVERSEWAWEYDARGRLAVEIRVRDADGDGPLRPSTLTVTTGYDRADYVTTKVVTVDDESDGSIDSTTTTGFGRDRRGRVLTSTVEDDTDNDGVLDGSLVTAVTYDAHGRILQVDTTSHAGDGTVLLAEVLAYDHDTRGRLVGSTQATHDGSGVLVAHVAYASTYDNRGNQATTLVRVDHDGDGVIDNRQEHAWEYDAGGRLVRSVVSQYADDAATMLTGRSEVRAGYDSRGRYTGAVSESDFGGDGGVDFVTREGVTYDAQGRRSVQLVEQDHDGDGTYDSRSLTLTTYDGRGRLEGIEFRSSSVGAADFVSVTAFAYPTRDLLVITVSDDFDDDGTVDRTYTQTRTVT